MVIVNHYLAFQFFGEFYYPFSEVIFRHISTSPFNKLTVGDQVLCDAFCDAPGINASSLSKRHNHKFTLPSGVA